LCERLGQDAGDRSRKSVNVEVVKRIAPCAWYAGGNGDCRWCSMLTHVRLEGTGSTLCGHDCLTDPDWMQMPGTHPEDVEAIDRCQLCYARLPKRELVL
jgi:hypothetical protein